MFKLSKKNIVNVVIYGLLLVFAVIYFTNFAIVNVNGSSMYPTYEDGESLLIRKTKDVKYKDVVIIHSDDLDELLCKRIIALEGDNIVLKNNKLYVNNELLVEDYINEVMIDNKDLNLDVQKDTVFVLGDNRNHSLDSRVLGNLKKSDIKGVVIFNLTEKLHYNNKIVFKLVCLGWFIVLLSLVYKPVTAYIKKLKNK